MTDSSQEHRRFQVQAPLRCSQGCQDSCQGQPDRRHQRPRLRDHRRCLDCRDSRHQAEGDNERRRQHQCLRYPHRLGWQRHQHQGEADAQHLLGQGQQDLQGHSELRQQLCHSRRPRWREVRHAVRGKWRCFLWGQVSIVAMRDCLRPRALRLEDMNDELF